MKTDSFYHIPLLSFFSRRFYRDLMLKGKGTLLGYLFVLLTLCWIPVLIQLNTRVADFMDGYALPVADQIPAISITDGVASINQAEPYIIRDPQSNEDLFIIDTSGTITALDDTQAKALVTKQTVTIKRNQYETSEFDLSEVNEATITRPLVIRLLQGIKSFFVMVLYPIVLVNSFVFRVLQIFLYSLIAMLFASLFHCTCPYSALFRLCVVAVTPCIIIKTIITLLPFSLPFAPLWYFSIALGYILFGILAVAKKPEQQA